MPLYSAHSSTVLAMAHPDLQKIFNEVIRWYDNTVAVSYITKAQAEDDFNKGLSHIHYPTKHNTKPSIAVDVYPYINGTVSFDLKQGLNFGGYVMAVANRMHEDGLITHVVRWGGDWNGNHDVNDNSFEDTGHFELIPKEGEVFQYYET